MKTEEDEAFDDLARKQGMWGGGFQAKRAAAADKLQEPEREALELALEALERINPRFAEDVMRQHEATAAIKAALALPAQEPFGWYSAQEDEFMTHKIRKEHERLNSFTHMTGKFDLALYTTASKREWVALTDEDEIPWDGVDAKSFARAIEAKLKEKNNG
jgi:hypothetical protein